MLMRRAVLCLGQCQHCTTCLGTGHGHSVLPSQKGLRCGIKHPDCMQHFCSCLGQGRWAEGTILPVCLGGRAAQPLCRAALSPDACLDTDFREGWAGFCGASAQGGREAPPAAHHQITQISQQPSIPRMSKTLQFQVTSYQGPQNRAAPQPHLRPRAPEQFLGPTGRQPQAMAMEAESSISRRDIPTFPPPGSRAWTVSPVSPRAQGRLCLEKGEPEALLKHKAGCCQTCSVGRVPGTSPKVLHKGSSVRQLQVKAARHSGLPGEGVGICCRRQGQPKPEGLPQTCVSCWEPSVQPQHRARALWQSCTAAAGKS